MMETVVVRQRRWLVLSVVGGRPRTGRDDVAFAVWGSAAAVSDRRRVQPGGARRVCRIEPPRAGLSGERGAPTEPGHRPKIGGGAPPGRRAPRGARGGGPRAASVRA